jgi:UDP-N-acetylmuramoylalanine--D-glutamate ligase
MIISGRKALVLGAGRSGVASTRFLAENGATVALHDRKPVEEWSDEARSLKDHFGVGMIGGDLPSWFLDQIDLVVISPGVPTNTIPARYVDRKDGEVVGEVELAYRFINGTMIGITGSNGKTTTTALIGQLLRDAGVPVQVGGNIGTPLIDLAASSRDGGWTVAELSSYQLETIVNLRPRIGLCLNVTPNHLDRYDSFLDYALAKHRLFMNQTDDDVAILNVDNEITADWRTGLRAKTIMFSVKCELETGAFLRGDDLVYRDGSTETLLTTRRDIFLPGLHNVENVLAAFAAGIAAGISVSSMRRTVREFKGVEHRIEFTAEINGVRYYNDSKATSVDATSKALEALGGEDGKIVLILGGRGKKAPYEPLVPLLRSSVRAIVVIGEDALNITEQLSGAAEVIPAASMDDAVEKCAAAAMPGDRVLLAPACASFDMFSSFEERGDTFKKCVLRRESSEVAKANS